MNSWDQGPRIEADGQRYDGTITPSTSANSGTVTSPGMGKIGSTAVSTAVGMAANQTPVSHVPGAAGMLAGAAGDLAAGRSPEQIGKSSAVRAAKTAAGYGLRGLGTPAFAIGPALSLGVGTFKESRRDNPNYARSTIESGIPSIAGTAGFALGGPLLGIVSGFVADAFVQPSLDSGWMGDVTDSRTFESARDDLESQGFSRGQSASAINGDVDMNSGYNPNSRSGGVNTFNNPNTFNYDPNADNPGYDGGYDSAGSGFGNEAADAASEDSGLGSMY